MRIAGGIQASLGGQERCTADLGVWEYECRDKDEATSAHTAVTERGVSERYCHAARQCGKAWLVRALVCVCVCADGKWEMQDCPMEQRGCGLSLRAR
jgi:hypothetical protein